jgi:hypothetical protein
MRLLSEKYRIKQLEHLPSETRSFMNYSLSSGCHRSPHSDAQPNLALKMVRLFFRRERAQTRYAPLA